MNKERLKFIADYLRNPPEGFTYGFNMSGFSFEPTYQTPDLLGECGSIYCIAGLANVFFGDDPNMRYRIAEEARELLDLTYMEAGQLFYGGGMYLSEITPRMAADTIERFIVTGEVKFCYPDDEDEEA